MTNFALEKASSAEVIAAYSTAQAVLPAVNSSTGWNVIGAFAPHLTARARLEIYGLVSVADLSLDVRLFDLEALEALGAVSLLSQSPKRIQGHDEELQAGRTYQMQARVISSKADPPDTEFGVLFTSTVTD